MSSVDNQTINNLDNKEWVDSLLIKDDQGKFTTLSSKEIIKSATQELSSAVSEGKSAPKDDNFAPIQYISGNAGSLAQFAFHPDDLKEVEELAKTMPKDDSKKYGIEKIVERIISKQELSIDSSKKNYFVNILFDFFRNRKSIISTRESLSNEIKLQPEQIDEVISVVKSIKSRIDSVGGLVIKMSEIKIPEEKPEEQTEKTKKDLPKAEMSVMAEVAEDKAKPEPEESPENKAKREMEVALKEISQESKIKAIEENTVKENQPAPGFDLIKDLAQEKKPVEKPIATPSPKEIPVKQEISLPKVSRPMPQSDPKKQITDVQKSSVKDDAPKVSHVLTGPVKEIESLDLVAFRRLGANAQQRVDKILDKINLLEQDSYTKKAQGIKAWRGSSLYRLYLDLGAQSMSEGEEVSNLIDKLQREGNDTLSIEEFSAISDLNQKMRF